MISLEEQSIGSIVPDNPPSQQDEDCSSEGGSND